MTNQNSQSTIPWEACAPQFANNADLSDFIATLPKDHIVRRAYSAIDAGGGQTCDVAGVFRELIRRGIRFIDMI